MVKTHPVSAVKPADTFIGTKPELQRPHWLESTQTQLGPPCLLSIITGQEMSTPQQQQISWSPGVLQVPNVLENNLIRDLMKPGVK